MMVKKTLAELAAAFSSKASGEDGGNQTWKLFFGFWKMPVDTITTVRFLPDADEDNPMGFLVENLAHELIVNGKREKVPCLKMYGEDCPICALSQKYYDKNSPDHNEALGKKYYRKKSYIGQVLVMETQIEHDQEQIVKLIEFGPKIFKQIQSAFQSGDMDNPPYELKGGYNFRIKKSKSGEYADYGTSSFSPKPTDVSDDVIELLLREDAPVSQCLFTLSDYRTGKMTRDVMDAMLMADQTGRALPQEDAPAPAPAAKAPAHDDSRDDAPAAKTTSQEAAPAPTGEKKLSVVEQLRQRAAAQKAKAEAE